MFAHGLDGIVTAFTASILGSPSLFDVEPKNDYLSPTELTSEEKDGVKSRPTTPSGRTSVTPGPAMKRGW